MENGIIKFAESRKYELTKSYGAAMEIENRTDWKVGDAYNRFHEHETI